MKEQKFFRCNICGNFVGAIKFSGVPMICCGKPMTEVLANTTDAALEKHVPVVIVNGNSVIVKIGSLPHPMEEMHYIEWVYLQTSKGGQRKSLAPGQLPEVEFCTVKGEKPQVAFAYCNLHSLWKAEIK